MVTVNFKRLPHSEALPLPSYQSDGAAGMDIRTAEEGFLLPGETKTITTGFAIACPENYEVQVRSRSGLAAKESVFVLNSPGTIDSDYRGEVLVILHNAHPSNIFRYNIGDRIAQLVVAPVVRAQALEVLSLPESVRGSGGLGSTGR